MDIRTILVPFDFSEHSEKAFTMHGCLMDEDDALA